MEIIKQSETFNLKDANETMSMTGSVSRASSGSINLHFSVATLEGDRVGDCNYNKYGESSDATFSVSCAEGHRDSLTAYADTVVDSVLKFLKDTE